MIRVEGNQYFLQIRGPQELYFEDELTRRNQTSKCKLKDFMKEAHQSWDSIDSDARTGFENQYKTLCEAANVLPNSTAATTQKPKRGRPKSTASKAPAPKKKGRPEAPRFETNDFDGGTAVQVQEEDESWRVCTVYRSKKTAGAVVLWFPETGEYEGLDGNYSACGDLIKDGDGDTIPSRACQQVNAATTVSDSPETLAEAPPKSLKGKRKRPVAPENAEESVSETDKWLNVWMDNDRDISAVPAEHRLAVLEISRIMRQEMEKLMPMGGMMDGLMYDSDDSDMHQELNQLRKIQAEMAAVQAAAAEGNKQPASANCEAYKAVLAGLDGKVFMFEQPYEDAGPVPTRESVLQKEHIVLPKVAGLIAEELRGEMGEVTNNHMGGGTSLGNKIWHNFLIPTVRNVVGWICKGEHQLALGELFGLLMFSVYGDDGWLMDNEVYMEDEFEDFFKQLGQSWKAVLAKSDSELGLADAKYRKKIKAMLKEFTKAANDALSNYDDVRFKFKGYTDGASGNKCYHKFKTGDLLGPACTPAGTTVTKDATDTPT